MFKAILRFFARIGLRAAAETVAEKAETGPITAGNVLKPAAKDAAAAIAKEALRRIPKKK